MPSEPRRRLYNILKVGAAAAALILAVLYGITRSGVHDAPIALDRPPAVFKYLKVAPQKPPAPDVQFADATGKMVRLADFKGKWVLLNLWATWCAPCVNELPALARAQSELASDRMAVIAVDLENHDIGKVGAFLNEHKAGALAAYVDRKLALMRAFTAYALPLTLVIDPQGREVARSLGPEAWNDRAVLAYLKGISAPGSN